MASETDKEGVQTVINILKSNIPKALIPNIESEFKKEFILGKSRSKVQKRKPTKKKTRALTRKEKKSLGFYEIPRKSVKYADMVPLNAIWADYISEILELDKPVPDVTNKAWEQFTQTLYKADFHGSFLHVARSKCPSYVGKKGICIMDTRNTFKIVTKDNIVTTIPKKECMFEMYVKNIKITLFGKQLCVRPAERSTKKIKNHLLPDL